MAGKLRRTWPQRITITLLILTSVTALLAATALAIGQWVLSDRRFVEIAAPDETGDDYRPPTVVVPGATVPTTQPADPSVTTTTIPLAEPEAANFLITGADNGDCVIDDPTIGDRSGLRSDTIMVWRVNPTTNQVAVLSFPRDLYVHIPGIGNRRINQAYQRDQPQLLIDTIAENFGVPVDHYVQLDFCAFKELVDAIGGVEVPFEYPARDRKVAFEVGAGCVNLDGIMALKYVRSRYYQWQDEDGVWRSDGTSDFGRISRQQDFIRRVIAKVIGDGLYKPDTVAALLDANRNYLTMDTGLTVRKVQEFANVIRRVDPSEIGTYRIESYRRQVGGADMQQPDIDGDNMQAILAVFRGHATIGSAPDQEISTTVPDSSATTTPEGGTGPLPTVVPDDNNTGIAPDPLATC